MDFFVFVFVLFLHHHDDDDGNLNLIFLNKINNNNNNTKKENQNLVQSITGNIVFFGEKKENPNNSGHTHTNTVINHITFF